MFSPDHSRVLAVNGEIYNHQAIRSRFKGRYGFMTGSDCEVILALYEEMGDDPAAMIEQLSGIFAFALYDERRGEFLIARGPLGVVKSGAKRA